MRRLRSPMQCRTRHREASRRLQTVASRWRRLCLLLGLLIPQRGAGRTCAGYLERRRAAISRGTGWERTRRPVRTGQSNELQDLYILSAIKILRESVLGAVELDELGVVSEMIQQGSTVWETLDFSHIRGG